MAESTITTIVRLEGGGDATIHLEKFDRWVVAGVTVGGLGGLPKDMDGSYETQEQAHAAACRVIESASGKKVLPFAR